MTSTDTSLQWQDGTATLWVLLYNIASTSEFIKSGFPRGNTFIPSLALNSFLNFIEIPEPWTLNKTKYRFKYKLSRLQAIRLYKSYPTNLRLFLGIATDQHCLIRLNSSLKTHNNTQNDKHWLQHGKLEMRRLHDMSEWNFHEWHCQSKRIKKHSWTINHIFYSLNKAS